MTETIHLEENHPFPNNPLPILYYPGAILQLLDSPDADRKALAFLAGNGYTNGWVNGIFSYHHFHSNTHEVLACISGEATVQLGGPGAEMYRFRKGDVLLLPAGTSHKRMDASTDFRIVGAYPDGREPDMQRGDAPDFEKIKEAINQVPIPPTDPVTGRQGGILEFWP